MKLQSVHECRAECSDDDDSTGALLFYDTFPENDSAFEDDGTLIYYEALENDFCESLRDEPHYVESDFIDDSFVMNLDGDQAGEVQLESNTYEPDKDNQNYLTPKEKAIAGVRRRRLANRTTSQKVMAHAGALLQVFMACAVGLQGLVHEVVYEPALDVWAVFQPRHHVRDTPDVDCLELFAGEARISTAFARRRRAVLEPRDLRYGHDFRVASTREEILRDVHHFKPGMIWMAPPCTVWCGFSRLNHGKQQLRRLRARERPIIEFVDDILTIQAAAGRLAVVENPRTSDFWRHPIVQRWITAQNFYVADIDLCSYGLKSSDYGIPMRKPLSLLSNGAVFAQEIRKRCANDHDHQRVQGAQTALTAIYPMAFADAVVKAYDRNNWSFRCNPVYMTQDGQVQHDPEVDQTAPVGADAISFKGKVNPTVASALKRIHQNLGHPNNRDLAKHLRLGGADASVIRAVEQMTCRTCDRSSKAKLHRVSSPATILDFNEAVAADVLWIDTADAQNLPCLNMVDMASTYQVVVPLDGTKSEDVARAFSAGWVRWAGAPKHLLVDMDSAFKDNFLKMLDQHCTVVQCAAGQAHWQNAIAERHGGTWKLIWAKLVEDHLFGAQGGD